MCHIWNCSNLTQKHELSVDEDWSLSVRTSYQGAIIYWQFRRRLMIISPESSRFLLHHRVIYERIDDTGTFPAFGLQAKRGALSQFYETLFLHQRDAERPWTSSPMSSATPADFIDVRSKQSTCSASWLWANRNCFALRTEKKISLSVYRFAPRDFARSTWHIQFAFHHRSLKK